MDNKKTVLHDEHTKLDTKMAPFGGYIMPIQYSGVIDEHIACRKKAAIFDTCHMGEFFVSGKNAISDLENILSCNISTIEIGQCRYGFICSEEGTTIDDMIIYRIESEQFMIVVNSGTQDNDFDWINSHCSDETIVENRSVKTAKIDIQGPESAKIVNKLLDSKIDDLKFYRFMKNGYSNSECIVSRTGYTGEIGFEIYLASELASKLWNSAIELGAIPAGLGARDTLRLEMGMPLYGHELSVEMNPAQTGFVRAIDSTKDFIGSKIVTDSSKITQTLTGIIFDGKQKPRDGETVSDSEGNDIGYITSGGYSPSLGCGVALAYVNKSYVADDKKIQIIRKRKALEGKLTSTPIYKDATGRKKLAPFL
jgi:aminomethyltransferase